jgi:hypothetical protein
MKEYPAQYMKHGWFRQLNDVDKEKCMAECDEQSFYLSDKNFEEVLRESISKINSKIEFIPVDNLELQDGRTLKKFRYIGGNSVLYDELASKIDYIINNVFGNTSKTKFYYYSKDIVSYARRDISNNMEISFHCLIE